MKFLLRILLAAIFGVLVLGQMDSVDADASVSSYYVGCEYAQFSGNSNAPFLYVTVFAWETATWYVEVVATPGDFNVEVTYPLQNENALMYAQLYGSTEGASPWGTYDGGTYFTIYEVACETEPLEVLGPDIPSGYVLRSITCDTPVYNLPAGNPVGSARVLAGQTFYVNPTPVTALDGTSWTRIFVSSRVNPYIPTACVR